MKAWTTVWVHSSNELMYYCLIHWKIINDSHYEGVMQPVFSIATVTVHRLCVPGSLCNEPVIAS